MGTLLLAAGSALWLGLLTSISPCPLATNIAAISYVGKRVDRPVWALAAGLAYTLGRTVSYILVALVVVKSLLSMSAVSMFLQQRLNQQIKEMKEGLEKTPSPSKTSRNSGNGESFARMAAQQEAIRRMMEPCDHPG